MDKKKATYTEGIVSIFANTALFGLKLWAGIVTGSIALTADAWHTLSDSFSSVIVIAGARLSSRKPDSEHPFGHGRWEQIASIFIGVLLAIIAFDFIRDAIDRFRAHESVEFGAVAIVVTIVSLVGKEALAQYAFYIGRKTGNSSVKADGWHHRTDALSSAVVLIGILLASKLWWIDGALGIAISLMLFYATYEILKESINRLLGERPAPDLIERVKAISAEVSAQDISPHHFHIHNYVSQQEMTFHIKLDRTLDIEEGHRIATEIERRIREELGITATVHMEPKGAPHDSD
jgi:cation diffusion facilitator family transporter